MDVVIWGDSITEHTAGHSAGTLCCQDVQEAFEAAFSEAGLQTVTLAISGDMSTHLGWRLRHGEWVTPPPRVGLLLIGTNDLGFTKVRCARCALLHVLAL